MGAGKEPWLTVGKRGKNTVEFDFGDMSFDMPDFDDGYGEVGLEAITVETSGKSVGASYMSAIDMASRVRFENGLRTFAFIPGSFVFGDFLEALVELRKITVEELSIHTLSLNEENIDSIVNVAQRMGGLKRLDIILSEYFYGNYRNDLVPYLVGELEPYGGRVAFGRIHTKIMTVKTRAGNKIAIHGSAILRSSGNIEQVCIECCPGLYDFIREFERGVFARYNPESRKTYHVRNEEIWQAAAKASGDAEKN